jgi:16S rRNA (guanine527-N7)-methyltransferase
MELIVDLERQLQKLGIHLDNSCLRVELDFLAELLRWNQTYNLTAVTDPVEAVEKHLVDSLTLLPHLGVAETILDIGSGGGFPGLPLRIAQPNLRVVSVDAVAKKIAFQRHVVRRLQLTGFIPWHGRVEDVSHQPFVGGGFDLIVARAFASLKDLISFALPCLKPKGTVVAMKGPEGEAELAEVGEWLVENGLRCTRQVSLVLPQSGAKRNLLFFQFDPQDIV